MAPKLRLRQADGVETKYLKLVLERRFGRPNGARPPPVVRFLRRWQRRSIAARPVSLEDGGQLLPQLPREHKTNATGRDEVVTGPV